jgi:hypothetical protein
MLQLAFTLFFFNTCSREQCTPADLARTGMAERCKQRTTIYLRRTENPENIWLADYTQQRAGSALQSGQQTKIADHLSPTATKVQPAGNRGRLSMTGIALHECT